MPDIAAVAGWVAGILSLVAYIPFILAILAKKARPNRATWIIWAIVSCIIAVSYYASGARETVWVPVCYSLGSTIIAVLSIKYGEGGWTRFDRSCLAGAGLGLLLWWWFKSPLIALFMNIAIDFIGALPTIRKSYLEPDGEDRATWALFLGSSIANVIAINKWTFTIALYPVIQISLISLITALVFRRKRTFSD
ncbi:MAG: hypothetical protein PHD72_02855 [Patescibacteria group bacterium]|nr:hypothetical protein [Patescibacteria group bacterium]